jgi:Tfp pilus assembly protein PilV
MGSCLFAKLRTALPSLGGEGGFTLVESMMAAVLLLAVGTTLSGVLASSVATYSAARERTLAEQLVMDQVEAIRRMPFSSVGLPNGNPSGTLAATRAINASGLKGTIALQVSYVDDQTPNTYRTYANYKKVVVTLTRAKDSKVLSKEITFLSAAARNAATESVINAQLIDLGGGPPIAGATVNLATGPSAPRQDVTDAGGTAIFPALTANPATGSQAYYDLNVTLPFGFQMLKDDLPPSGVAHTQLGVAQTWPTTLHAYKPCNVSVSIPSPPKDPATQTPLAYTVSIGSVRGTQTFAQAASASFLGPVSSIASEPLVPLPSSAGNAIWINYTTANAQYTAGASAVVGSGSSAKYWFATAVSQPVPVDYVNGNLGQSFTLNPFSAWLTSSQVTALTIKVQNASGTLLGGVRVNVQGGPAATPVYLSGTTGTSGSGLGLATIYVPSSSTGYTVTAWGPATSDRLTGQSITGSSLTKTITVS